MSEFSQNKVHFGWTSPQQPCLYCSDVAWKETLLSFRWDYLPLWALLAIILLLTFFLELPWLLWLRFKRFRESGPEAELLAIIIGVSSMFYWGIISFISLILFELNESEFKLLLLDYTEEFGPTIGHDYKAELSNGLSERMSLSNSLLFAFGSLGELISAM